jgi:hypothetical protein
MAGVASEPSELTSIIRVFFGFFHYHHLKDLLFDINEKKTEELILAPLAIAA